MDILSGLNFCVTDQVLGYWTLLNLDLQYWDDKKLEHFSSCVTFLIPLPTSHIACFFICLSSTDV